MTSKGNNQINRGKENENHLSAFKPMIREIAKAKKIWNVKPAYRSKTRLLLLR